MNDVVMFLTLHFERKFPQMTRYNHGKQEWRSWPNVRQMKRRKPHAAGTALRLATPKERRTSSRCFYVDLTLCVKAARCFEARQIVPLIKVVEPTRDDDKNEQDRDVVACLASVRLVTSA
jgi:hypothetical protein